MNRVVALLLAVTLAGCAESLVLPVDETLTHDEVVGRLKKLMKDNLVLNYDMTFLFDGSEERVSPTITRLRYQHSTPQPPPSLYTPAVSYDWTIIDIDTSRRGEVRLSVETYRRGNFTNDRQHETESKIVEQLSILKDRANKSLQAAPKSGAPEP